MKIKGKYLAKRVKLIADPFLLRRATDIKIAREIFDGDKKSVRRHKEPNGLFVVEESHVQKISFSKTAEAHKAEG